MENQEHNLIDLSGRKIRKLRVSLLDTCNFRCTYCMPDNPKFMHHSKLLKPSEIFSICSVLSDLGLEQIRLTGGEPLLRREFREIVTSLSRLPIKKLGLTTNAFALEKHLPLLTDTKCSSINISLDSLNENKFNMITKSHGFKRVMSAILKASEMGFQVKINTVLLRGVNDMEIRDFVKFSADNNIEVRFLEMMRIGQARDKQDSNFLAAGEVIENLQEVEDLTPITTEFDSTSFNFATKSGAQIGFIASESRPFCNSCSRLRLSADGFLRACLLSEKGLALKDVDESKYEEILHKVMGMKPTQRIAEIKQDMYQIGG